MLIGPAAVAQTNDSLWGELACLGAALSYAFAGIYGRRFRAMGVTPLDAAAGQVTASSLLILPIMLSLEQPERLESRKFAGMALIGLGLMVIDGRIGRLLHPAK